MLKAIALGFVGLLCAHAEVTLPLRKPQREFVPEAKRSEPIREHLPSWIVEVELGSNLQTFSLIVDTGSGLLGVYGEPCSACRFVGPTYNPRTSSTSASVGCNGLCSVCSGSQCQTKAAYLDGSGWTGNVVSDTVSIAGKSARTNFAYMVNASSSFVQNWEQGILGLGYSGMPGYPYPVIGDILAQNGLTNEFWLDLNRDGTGAITLGAPDNQYINGALKTVNVYATFNPNVFAFYRVSLQGMTVNGESIGDSTDFGLTIVDSGTTVLLLPSFVYSRFISALDFNLPCRTSLINNKVCSMTLAEIALWPQIQVTFDNLVVASMWPQDYLQARTDVGYGYYQLGVSSSQSTQCLLGDPFLSNRYTGFDRATNTLQFTDNSSSSMAVSGLLMFVAFFAM